MPRKILARKTLRIRTQVTMQGTEDVLMVFTKPECKDHRSKSGEEPDGFVLTRSRKSEMLEGRLRQKGLVRGAQVRRKGKAKEPRRAKVVQEGEGHPIQMQDGEVWGQLIS